MPMTPEQIETLGFATIVKPTNIQACAFINKKNNMDSKLNDSLTVFGKLLDRLSKLIPQPKAMVITDVNGVNIDFGTDITDPSQIVEGVTGVTIDGQPATGNYVIANGTTITIEAGEVKAVTAQGGSEIETLKKENEALKQQLSDASKKATDAEANINSLNGEVKAMALEFEKLKKMAGNYQLKSSNDPGQPTGEPNMQNPQAFTYKGKKQN
jgi:hypothetical protein